MKKRISAMLLAFVMVLSLLPTTAFAAAGGVPAHSKTVELSEDGTYMITLTVTGDAERQPNKANVVVVLDTSGSMDEDTGNGEETYTPTTSDGRNLYGKVDGEYVPLHSERRWVGGMIFGHYEYTYYYPWTGNASTSTVYTGDRYIRSNADQTRLEAAQEAVKDLASALLANNEVEGNPTDTIELALVSFATTAAAAKGPITDYDTFAGWVDGLEADGGTNWENALSTAKSVDFDDNDPTYVIFVSDGNPTFRSSPNGYTGDYYSYGVYGDGGEGNQNVNRCYAAAEIAAQEIKDDSQYKLYTIGVYGNAGRMSGLPNDGYYSAEDTAALKEALNEILAEIEMAGIGNVGMSDGTTNQVATSAGVVSLLTVDENSYKYYRDDAEWKTTDDPAAPEAQLVNGAVEWDLSSLGVLENGVVYKITFQCTPSQEAFDLIADLKNGDKDYDSLDPNIKKYLIKDGDDYALLTNTETSLTYVDTRTGEEGSTSFDEQKPVPAPTSSMTVTKVWENELDERKAEPVAMKLTRDDNEIKEIEMSDTAGWTQSVFIATGQLTVDKTKKTLNIFAKGHDYTLTEPEKLGYYWDLEIETIRPMIINGVLTTLIKVDNEDVPSGMTGDYYAAGGEEYYRIDGSVYKAGNAGVANLTATNHRRSNLNLTKVVTGTNPPSGAKFTFKLSVTDPKDKEIWFSVMDTDEPDKPIKDITTTATPEDGDTGYYHFPSGSEITVDLQAGWNLRILNLLTGSEYTIEEIAMPDGFVFVKTSNGTDEGTEKKVTGKIDDTNKAYEVTYTDDYELKDITVTKVWDDANNQDGIRPDELELTLNGLPKDTAPEPEVKKDGNTWTYTWKGLPKSDSDGKEIEYTVTEGTVPTGYTCTTTTVNPGGTITNKHEPETTKLTVTKVWKDAGNQDEIRPDSVTFTVTGSDGKTYKPVLSGEGDTWTAEVEVEKYFNGGEEVAFTVDEAAVEGYTKEIDNKTLTITNTHDTEKDTITVTKIWDDASDQDGKRPDSVKFTVTGSDGNSYDVELSGEGNKWTKTVQVEKNQNTRALVTFTVDEDAVAGYTKEIDNNTLTITNSYTPETIEEIKVTKIWDDASNQDGKRPESITINLMANGEKVDSKTVTEEKEWACSFTKLPKYAAGEAIKYTVTEDAVADYSTEITGSVEDGFTITNSYTPGKTSVTVTKAWSDGNDKDKLRPESVTVQLMADDEPYGDPVTLNADNTWTYTWRELSLMAEGKEIKYTVQETKVPEGYEATYSGSAATGFTITNKHTPEQDPPVNPPVIIPVEPPVLNTEDHYAYIIGNDEGLVLPNAPITRAEVATIFFRMLTDESRDSIWSQVNPFPDVLLENWFNNAVSTMTNGNILTGYPDGTFRPNSSITRAEFATIAIRFFQDAKIGPSKFSDTIGHWAEEYINKAANQGLIEGYPDGTFRPDAPITRAEAMTIINRVLDRHPDKDHLLDSMIKWPDNMDTTKWYYAQVQEATNSHDYTMHGMKNDLYEIWQTLLPVRDWAAFENAWSTSHAAYNPGDVVGH